MRDQKQLAQQGDKHHQQQHKASTTSSTTTTTSATLINNSNKDDPRRPSGSGVRFRKTSASAEPVAQPPAEQTEIAGSQRDLARPLRIRIPDEMQQPNAATASAIEHDSGVECREPLLQLQPQQRNASHSNATSPMRATRNVAGNMNSMGIPATNNNNTCCCCDNRCCEQMAQLATPVIGSVAERFVLLQQHPAQVPKKKAPPQHRRLRKYASETSFCSSPGKTRLKNRYKTNRTNKFRI